MPTVDTMNADIRPKKFAHVVYRTRRFDEMIRWYQTVFAATVQHQNPVLAFLTYDDEHHRIALLNLGLIKGEGETQVPRGSVGVDHVAYGFDNLYDLFEKYRQLKSHGILPYWSIHHGITLSLYYADPDGNQMEFQVECFDNNEDANGFMKGPHFEVNAIGVEFDPDEMLRRLSSGEPGQNMLPRHEHLPVSEVRGSIIG